MTFTIDKHATETLYSPVCTFCRHLRGHRLCDAFGEAAIPLDIWEGHNLHRSPVKGDHGIQFESIRDDEPGK